MEPLLIYEKLGQWIHNTLFIWGWRLRTSNVVSLKTWRQIGVCGFCSCGSTFSMFFGDLLINVMDDRKQSDRKHFVSVSQNTRKIFLVYLALSAPHHYRQMDISTSLVTFYGLYLPWANLKVEKVKEWYKSFNAIAEQLLSQTATINLSWANSRFGAVPLSKIASW